MLQARCTPAATTALEPGEIKRVPEGTTEDLEPFRTTSFLGRAVW
jgi:hypothetical protein